jgi:hypothetical protein
MFGFDFKINSLLKSYHSKLTLKKLNKVSIFEVLVGSASKMR